ncbi:hypothetical protein ACQKL5_02625 [Peribacillus sp. NPDC097675]|uniref:hypothetical protein n=1 Tax=Peribacillus sp. NPDC097675 TaxID=3390618 RepID=UPI003D064319
MHILACKGFELEKGKPNSPEDFFNRSTVKYIKDGEEKSLNVVYLRYFDERITQWTPYPKDPIFKSHSRDIYMADIIALICLIKEPSLSSRKRVYINSEKDLASYFLNLNFNKLEEVFRSIEQAKPYDINTNLDFYLS